MITKFDRPFELTNPIPDVISVKDVKKRIDQVFNETCDAYRGNTCFSKTIKSLTFDMDDRQSGTVHINVKGRPVIEYIEPVVGYLNFSMNPAWTSDHYISSVETVMQDIGCAKKGTPAFKGDAAKLEDVYATAQITDNTVYKYEMPFTVNGTIHDTERAVHDLEQLHGDQFIQKYMIKIGANHDNMFEEMDWEFSDDSHGRAILIANRDISGFEKNAIGWFRDQMIKQDGIVSDLLKNAPYADMNPGKCCKNVPQVFQFIGKENRAEVMDDMQDFAAAVASIPESGQGIEQ